MEFKRTPATEGKPGARPVNNVWQDVNEFIINELNESNVIGILAINESLLVEMLDARLKKKYNAEMIVKLLRNGFYDARKKLFIFKRKDFIKHQLQANKRVAGKELVL